MKAHRYLKLKDPELLDYVEKLQQSAIASYFTIEQIEWLMSHCNIVQFKRDHRIYEQGQHTNGLYFILDGKVDLIAQVLGQGVINIETMNVGDILGGICFIDQGPCATSAVAKTTVTCLYVGGECFQLLGVLHPEMKYKLLEAISVHVCHRMKRTHDKAVKFISEVNMASLSLIGRVIHSLTQPTIFPLSTKLIRKEGLAHNPLLQIFTEEERKWLFKQVSFLEAPKNCILIHEEDNRPSCFIVLHGAVQSSIMHDNKLAKLSVIGPNSLFASVACVANESKFTITFITCEAAVLLKISEKALKQLKKERPQLWYKLFILICESLVALGKSINKLDIRLHIESYNR